MSKFSAWMMAEIKFVCTHYQHRVAGSQSVRACLHHMADQLSAWSDDVDTEAFTLHPQAFIGSIPLQALCDICGVVCFWLSYFLHMRLFSVLCLAFFAISLLSWVLEYVLYRRAFDFLYPRRQSENVIAVRRAKGETRQRIILCGHADAAYEMPFLLHMKAGTITLLIISADVGMILCVILSALRLLLNLPQAATLAIGAAMSALLPTFFPFLFFANWRIVTDGANDNLSACYIGMSILKEMAEHDERLAHTDVCCLITDGEESGLRGALAYAEAHRQELLTSHTIVIAADTIHDAAELMIYHRGVNFTQKNSPAVCDLLHRAGQACGADLPYATFYPGATDAEAFSRYGIPAAAICAVSHQPSTYYHTRFDSWDNLDADCLELTRSILKSAVHLYDADCTAHDACAKE